jgi:hypothetical protein
MITSEYLNSEKDLAKRIFIYHTDKLLAFLNVGSDSYLSWYKKSCNLYYLIKGLMSFRISGNKLYLGSEEVNLDLLYQYTSNIREYVPYDVREFQYINLDVMGNVKDITIIPTPPILISYTINSATWKYYVVDVLMDDAATVTLPFNFAEADPNSLNLTVNDGDPVFLVSPSEEGFHIIGSTLYWHTYYNLKAGDKISIRYLKIA